MCVSDPTLPVAAHSRVIDGPLLAEAQSCTRALDARFAPTLVNRLAFRFMVGYCRWIVQTVLCITMSHRPRLGAAEQALQRALERGGGVRALHMGWVFLWG